MTMPSSERQSRRYEEHLTDAELNDLIDGTLASNETERAQTHLASCAECDERSRTLQATVHALNSAPSLMPRRSFQLSPEQAKTPPKNPTLFDRFSEWIVPGVPAIRAATLAVALLLISVTAIDVLTHRGSNQESAGPVLMQQQQTSVDEAPPAQSDNAANAAPTSIPAAESSDSESAAQREADGASGGAVGPSSAQESAADNASDSAIESASESSAAQAPQAPAPASAFEPTGEMVFGAAPSMAEASPVATLEPTATASSIPATATASPIPATATPVPSPTPAAGSGGSAVSISPWRIAELGLLMLLIWLGVSWLGRSRIREDEPDDQSEPDNT